MKTKKFLCRALPQTFLPVLKILIFPGYRFSQDPIKTIQGKTEKERLEIIVSLPAKKNPGMYFSRVFSLSKLVQSFRIFLASDFPERRSLSGFAI